MEYTTKCIICVHNNYNNFKKLKIKMGFKKSVLIELYWKYGGG